MEEIEPSAPRETLAEEPLVATEGAGIVTAQAAPERGIEPASIEEVERPLRRKVLIKEPPVARADDGVTGAAEAWPEARARARSPVSKTLIWTAMGGALLLFVCVAGLVLIAAASSALRIDTASLQVISRGPSALLAVSLASFLGAILLLGLLVWALRQGPK